MINFDQSNSSVIQGVSKGVLYTSSLALPWFGLISVDHSSEYDTISNEVDGFKTADAYLISPLHGKISAYTFPTEFEEYIGNNELYFGLCYRSEIVDVVTNETSYELHLVYNMSVVDDGASYSSVEQLASATNFSWSFNTVPVDIPNYLSASHIIIRSKHTKTGLLEAIEKILYGYDEEPRLPTPEELFTLFNTFVTLVINDHGNGIFTAIGPDDVVYQVDTDEWVIDWESVKYISSDTVNVSSY